MVCLVRIVITINLSMSHNGFPNSQSNQQKCRDDADVNTHFFNPRDSSQQPINPRPHKHRTDDETRTDHRERQRKEGLWITRVRRGWFPYEGLRPWVAPGEPVAHAESEEDGFPKRD